jgi:hypothetical protein
MPYNFTHALVGLTALEQVRPPVRSLIDAHRGEFLIGTMGPDPYFGDSRPKPLFAPCREELADRLHSLDARNVFRQMFALSQNNDVLTVYTLGFLCHFLLDTTAHPYIEARFPGKAHTPAEIRFDLMMTDRVGFPGVPAPPKLFYHTNDLTALDRLHARLAEELFQMQTQGAFARGFRKWIFINTLSYDPHDRKLRFFSRIEDCFNLSGKITGFIVAHHPDPDDRMNLSHEPWCAPWDPGRSRTESFVDLFDAACKEAPALLNAAYTAMQGGDHDAALALIGSRRMDAKPVSD